VPLTLPTHPLAVVPLKLWRPHWFDGVALAVGAIAPDVAYAADGYGVTIHSHTWHSLLWWNLPVTLAGARLVRWAAPTVAAHLPAGGALALRDYGALGPVRPPWFVTVISALIGALSHIVWDAFTHPTLDGGYVLFPALHRQPWPGVPWWYVLATVSDLVGYAAAAGLIVYMGHHRLVRRWHGPPPPVGARPGVFWTVTIVVVAAGAVVLALQPVQYFPAQAIRGMLIVALALTVAVVATGSRSAPESVRESTVDR
jgi:hypothetical protein